MVTAHVGISMTDQDVSTRVVVPLDGSVEARHALNPALRIARVLKCPIDLVTVHEPVNGQWANNLDAIAAQLPYEQVDVEMVASGRPGDVITAMAAEHPGTLLCMSAMHRDEFDRLVLGSVSSHVLRTSTTPVLFTGPGYVASREPERYERLVVCLDGSSRADTALRVATGWAHRFGMHVELVRVVASAEEQDSLEDINKLLAQRTATLAADDVSVTATLLHGDDPAASIAELVSSRPNTLALTATHGRTGLTRILLGSVTAELLNRSPSPVLVVRSV